MMDVVEAEAALDAKPVVIGRAVAAFGVDHLLVLDLIGDLAADAAERAQRIDLLVGIDGAGLVLIQHHRRHQRAGRAGLHAFAAGDAGRFPHRIVEIEHDLGIVVAIGHADHVVDLDLAAGAHAQAALDAGIEIDAHGRMAGIACQRSAAGKRLSVTSTFSAQCQNFESGSCEVSRAGWSATRSSITIFCAATARALADFTFMPTLGVRLQDAANTRSPSISTMQARQLPSGR